MGIPTERPPFEYVLPAGRTEDALIRHVIDPKFVRIGDDAIRVSYRTVMRGGEFVVGLRRAGWNRGGRRIVGLDPDDTGPDAGPLNVRDGRGNGLLVRRRFAAEVQERHPALCPR